MFEYKHSIPEKTAPPPYKETGRQPHDVKEDFEPVTSTLPDPFPDPYVPASAPIEAQGFVPGKKYHIAARGMRLVRLPCPSSELEINVYNTDGTIAYTSTRAKRRSGNCILSRTVTGGQDIDLVSTEYRYGPGRPPSIIPLNLSEMSSEPLATGGEWTSRAVIVAREGDDWQAVWAYEKMVNAQGKHEGALVLRFFESKEQRKIREGRVLAQLIRNEETRTPLTSKSTAGNGGLLVLDEHAARYLDEALVVATCIMMLKKEMDRRRFLQFMFLGAMAGGSP